MKPNPDVPDPYLVRYAGQIPVLGEQGQERLAQASYHVSGAGRVGSNVVINLVELGARHISVNDPQSIEEDNLGAFVFTRSTDKGKPKVYVLEKFLHGRDDLLLDPVCATTESPAADPYIQHADIVFSCANTVAGRLAAESKAIRYGKAVIQVAAFDGRKKLGGVIAVRLPGNHSSACFGCYLADSPKFERGEGLLTSVTSALAAMAVNIAVQLITFVRFNSLPEANLFMVDLERYGIYPVEVERREGCEICAVADLNHR
jgi:molybdopterin-synthase adenylyltransferase